MKIKTHHHHAHTYVWYVQKQRNKQKNKYFDTYRDPFACDLNVSEQILMLIRIGFCFFVNKKREIEIEMMESALADLKLIFETKKSAIRFVRTPSQLAHTFSKTSHFKLIDIRQLTNLYDGFTTHSI